MKIIAVTNRKGGVGKSTISIHVAAGLAAQGWNVGLVDTDSQGHAGLMLGMPEEDGLYQALIKKVPLVDVVREVPAERYTTPDQPALGKLYLLPSSENTHQIPSELKAHESLLLLQKLEELAVLKALDVVIMDTNPTLNLLDGAVYLAADGYIYVTECEQLSYDGIYKALEQMREGSIMRQQFLNRDTRVIGIIPNKMFASTVIHRHNLEELVKQFPGFVWNPIRRGTVWVEAAQFHEPVYIYAPGGNEAKEAWRIVERVKEAINQWDEIPTE